ncbi:unnamed protein product [Nyctereutes procyonoides]|uniref:(raccoon dog) hypothetical protein n=1 Tax=Nyctereutes procyonoides TaxID=34880 RepID=A0A811Z6D1_NYCPR|nr:unnamed protein product [Nyctereutes procyonoides]
MNGYTRGGTVSYFLIIIIIIIIIIICLLLPISEIDLPVKRRE